MKNKCLILIALIAVVACGCSSQKKNITSSPAPYELIPDIDGLAALDVQFTIPDRYLPSRSRLFITPALMCGDTVTRMYEPLVLDASIYRKKTERKEVLHGYVDPWADRVQPLAKGLNTVAYRDTIEIPDDVENGRIVGVISNDGCGICSGIDTIEIASVSIPANTLDPMSAWIEPRFVVKPKEYHGKGVARLQFIVDKWDIVMDLADNRRELTQMVETLQPILSDSLTTLTSLDIFGSASAEASYQHNIMLANNRANSAKRWLAGQLQLSKPVLDIIKVGAAPEGWEPVVQAMIAANDPDSTKVRELMDKYPGPTDDAAEKYIRRLACWPRIRANYLAKDRKVTYEYSWTVKSFTNDSEMIEIYRTRPDAFNEEEFLHVATLAADDDSRIEVYGKLLERFPGNTVAANNLALLYLAKDDSAKAAGVMERHGGNSPQAEYVRTMISVWQGDNDAAARHLKNAIIDDGLRQRAMAEPTMKRLMKKIGGVGL